MAGGATLRALERVRAMKTKIFLMIGAAVLALGGAGLVACSNNAALPVTAGIGPQPTLPDPARETIQIDSRIPRGACGLTPKSK